MNRRFSMIRSFHLADWITVAEDYNQSFLYAQAGLTAAVNHPDARMRFPSSGEFDVTV